MNVLIQGSAQLLSEAFMQAGVHLPTQHIALTWINSFYGSTCKRLGGTGFDSKTCFLGL